MAEKNSNGSSGFQALLNGLLLLVTLVGGYFLVSQKLTSERPVNPTLNRSIEIGDQTLNARLWEDPFSSTSTNSFSVETITNQIARHIQEDGSTNTEKVLLLPVMIPGGPYSEDQECRIRTRFAVVSALGRSGYAPTDAEHIGCFQMDWPQSNELEDWQKKTNALLTISNTNSIGTNNPIAAHGSKSLNVYYEWYRPRVFVARGTNSSSTNVLVLWLNEEAFESDPLPRLALFLAPFRNAINTNGLAANDLVHLIGPRRSSLLRAMLPDQFSGETQLPITLKSNLWRQVTNVLATVSLYSPSASAMDEVLITNKSSVPRESLRLQLVANGFRDAKFFNCTDAQLAEAIFSELKLRRADLSNPKNHLVLLSEWDTFYGRMLSLTYGASLALEQTNSVPGFSPVYSRNQFIDDYRTRHRPFPANFHTYVYLRGLDGRTVSDGNHAETRSENRQNSKPGSVEDFLHWTPDSNKAEGPGQFDYLSRTGEWLEKLQTELKRTDQGQIKAIGIVGSDAYDVLLILQALRHRFPEIYFFTTDLDVRYWHPDECEWSRNLIIASSYGLRLHSDFQGEIAPFRDSSQTAHFAATLAALGNSDLAQLKTVQPRIFEVGNHNAVDLSTSSSALNPDIKNPAAKHWLHPLRLWEEYTFHPERTRRFFGFNIPADAFAVIALIVFLSLIFLYYYWIPFHIPQKTDTRRLGRKLLFSSEDVAGQEGAYLFLSSIEAQKDPFCIWFARTMRENQSETYVQPKLSTTEQNFQNQTDAFLEHLNSIVLHIVHDDEDPSCALKKRNALHQAVNESDLMKSFAVNATLWETCAPWWRPFKRILQRYRGRQFLDHFLDQLTPSDPKGSQQILSIAKDARLAARKLFWMRVFFELFYPAAAAVILIIAAGMGHQIWIDTFVSPTGEPFSITSGISAWPNIILRTICAATGLIFIIVLIQQLRTAYYQFSRHFRIPFAATVSYLRPQHVCASHLWKQFHQGARLRWRFIRAAIPAALYFCFGMTLLRWLGIPFEPIRGNGICFWADPITLPGNVHIHPFAILFLLLSFLTIDAALRCRRFIDELSAAPTEYPETTRNYFKSIRGDVHPDYLDEWIDTQLIADLTERIQRYLWFPAIVLLLMLISRNQYTDHWPWNSGLLIMIGLNFILSIASIVILQLSARKAKRRAEESLYSKVKKAQANTAPTPQANDATQAEKLLDEIRHLNRGAFVGFWENPVLGAVLLAPSGTAIVQLFIWIANH